MDSISKSHLDNFITKFGFNSSIKESEAFEHFSAFTLLTQEVNGNLLKPDLEAISTGQAKGVDTIAFCINEKLVLTSDEVDNFENQSLLVDIFFLQSKTTEGFSDTELGNFLDVVIDFFSDKPQYNIAELEGPKEIYKKLLKKLATIREFNLHCLYVSLGQKQQNETTMDSTKNIKKALLANYNLFKNIDIDLIDKSTLINAHKKAISPLRATIKFDNKIQLTGIADVDEAYIGFIPFSEFKNLIMDDNQIKIKSLFNDNLRDFLGLDNPINQGIKKTLEDKKFNEFSLLNNGVTVIADSNTGKGNTLILENYQIVNGCQTSNVLFECKEIPEMEKVLIPLKVVITKKEELRDEIILTTNSQSKFTEEQLFAITQFQKTLEDFYNANKTTDNLFYERRTNQFSNSSISRSSIIEIKEQLKSFMAMFFDLPHLVAGNIGKVVSTHKDKFFQKDHSPIPYYISGLLSTKWDKLLLNDDNYKEFNKYRYHIFMGFRYLVEDLQFQESYLKSPKNYSIKVEQKRENSYDKLLSVLRNDEELKNTIDLAIELFKKSDYNRAKGAYSNPITQEYKKNLQDYINSDTEAEVTATI
ncbi:MAG: AIPR family protein [Chitinophagaceae bacterium]|nr:AIPR family protein [Chitinophagaceae bacterium]MCW5905073.1 AIPR family protein [Chitinophagaceae bacterium]